MLVFDKASVGNLLGKGKRCFVVDATGLKSSNRGRVDTCTMKRQEGIFQAALTDGP